MSNVNHPIHYNQRGLECIDAMVASCGTQEVAVFCKLNAFKYLWRANDKANRIEDLEKAAWYVNKAVQLYKLDPDGDMEADT